MEKVFLVGAGPGDPSLLTLKAKHVLEAAEVVVYDRLVSEDILALAPPGAKRVDVGKNVGNHPVPQWRINEVLAEEYGSGKNVVRLKGGDSFVFGRGGEELLHLHECGIPFEVVPGITSAIAAAAYAGIPVTHRDYCASLHIITGHRRENGRLMLDYEALVRLNGTLVFMMSVGSMGEITAGLMQAGMAPETACAIIENGTLPQQRKLLTTLACLEADKKATGIESPAVLLVGSVCALSQKLDWFSALPLKGRRILVTRPHKGAERFAGMLRALGAQVTVLPAIETRPLPFRLPELSLYTTLVFTSPVGVSCFFERLYEETDARALHGKKIAVVGKETAKALWQYGLRAELMPDTYSGEALGNLLVKGGTLEKEECLLLLRSKIALPELEKILRDASIQYDAVSVYDTITQPMAELDPAGFDCITLTSASCAQALALAAKGQEHKLNQTPAVCIGTQTEAAAKKLGLHTVVANEASLESMMDAILELFQ